MMEDERTLLLEEEYLIVRDSGEIPEIALHSSLHYLSEDPEGPGILLNNEELVFLQDAALERSREIVLRDLDPENRDLGMYRGVRRSIYNWQRLLDFCERIGRDCSSFAPRVASALVGFLERELEDVRKGERTSSVNCTVEQLSAFAGAIGLSVQQLPDGWQELCPG